MKVQAVISMKATRRRLKEDAWCLGLLLRCQMFALFRSLSIAFIGGAFASAFFGTAFGAAGAALALVGTTGAALAGVPRAFAFGSVTVFLGPLRDCSIDLALASSLSSTKNSCNLPHR